MAAAQTERERRVLVILARLFPLFERLGIHVTRNHFYEPVPELRALGDEIFRRHSELPGLGMREEQQLELLDQVAAFKPEYGAFPAQRPDGDPTRYFVRNGQFGRVDAEVLHALVRLCKPRRVLEIGSGYSTLVTAGAIRGNRADDPNYSCELISIDPYPPRFLRRLPELTRLLEQRVQDLPVETFAELGPGDMLFIDSSHVLKIGSDVQFEFLELLPRVAKGVWVHVHDIFFPTDYPRPLVMEWHRFWNEQYLLQAFLAFNSAFAVRWCGSWMAHRHESRIREAFPSFDLGGMWPSSFWMERV